MATLNKKLFGSSVTANIVRAGGKCWERLTSTAATTPDYTQKQVVGTHVSGDACLAGDCSSNQPSMLVSVAGTTGTINWCGETWNLDAGESGQEREVCPTSYEKRFFSSYTANNGSWNADHFWGYSISLNLHRAAGTNLLPSGASFKWSAIVGMHHFNQVNIQLGSATFGSAFKIKVPKELITTKNTPSLVRPLTSFYPTNSYYAPGISLNGLLTQPYAMENQYLLTDSFFGSYTTGGITYTWKKGSDWP